MDEAKRDYREGKDTVKEEWRNRDGEDLADKVGNAGDDIRRKLGDLGDDLRGEEDRQREVGTGERDDPLLGRSS